MLHRQFQVDLDSNARLAQLAHTSAVDWLEVCARAISILADRDRCATNHRFQLNETAERLLFRDVRSALYLYDVASARTTNLINFCSYVQWVPQSDVVSFLKMSTCYGKKK